MTKVVTLRGTVVDPKLTAAGGPQWMMGLTTAADNESHIDFGAHDGDKFFLHLCNHVTGKSAIIQLNRPEFRAMIDGLLTLVEEFPEVKHDEISLR
jgi:hypothetical protein